MRTEEINRQADEYRAMDQGELDELVCDIKAAEASEINNQGREYQIDYLLDLGDFSKEGRGEE